MKSKILILIIPILILLNGCNIFDTDRKIEYGTFKINNVAEIQYTIFVPNGRTTVSEWKHVLPNSATLLLTNVKTNEKFQFEFNPQLISENFRLPYGEYMFECRTDNDKFSNTLPFTSNGQFKLDKSEYVLNLDIETKHGLITILNENITGVPTIKNTTLESGLELKDNFYYKYVESGNVVLNVVENTFETIISKELVIEPYKHYNFRVVKNNGNVGPPELLIRDFELIDEELSVTDEDIKNYIYLENFGNNINEAWPLAVTQEGKILRLLNNKTYKITEFKTVEPKIKAIVGKNSTIIFGKDNFNQFIDTDESGSIFRFTKDNPEFGVVGVNLLQAEKTPLRTATHSKVLFESAPGAIKTGKLAWINSRPPNNDWLTVKLAGFMYSGTNGDNNDFFFVIGKDLVMTGPDVSQFKANAGGGLYSILQNVDIINPFVGSGLTSYFNPTSFLADGYLENDVYTITNDVDTYSVRTVYNYQAPFRRCIFHIGRFVFNISNESVLDSKRIKLNIPKNGDEDTYIKVNENTIATNIEMQPGDVTNLGKVVEKQIELYYGPDWTYIFDKPITNEPKVVLIESTFNLSGKQQSYLVYKSNEIFYGQRLTENTKFGDHDIIIGGGYGWTMYNHKEITIHWENVKFSGFYRQSASNRGNSQGYTLINTTGLSGQFSPPVSVKTQGEIPIEAKNFINWLENLK